MNYRGSIHCKVRYFSLCHHRHLHTGFEAIRSLGTQCSAAGAWSWPLTTILYRSAWHTTHIPPYVFLTYSSISTLYLRNFAVYFHTFCSYFTASREILTLTEELEWMQEKLIVALDNSLFKKRHPRWRNKSQLYVLNQSHTILVSSTNSQLHVPALRAI